VLKQRVLTAVVLVAALLASLAWSPLAFAALITLGLAIAQAEWLKLSGWPFGRALMVTVAAGIGLLYVLTVRPLWVERASVPLAILATVAWVAIGAMLLRSGRPGGVRIEPPVSTPLAFLLPLAAWCALMLFLRAGVVLLVSVLLIVWLADTAAYFAGRAFGRSKLAPHISPGKTWAGVWGAMLGVALAAIAAWMAWPGAPLYTSRMLEVYGVPLALVMFAGLVAISIVGDLFESLLKRQAGAKDSGQLLPGHGGFYDRIDSMLALLPAAALLWSVAT
jgi:phosphatidate cytidylyltransferase